MENWLLLDNQSTADIFCNKNVLKNVHGTSDVLHLDTNGGTLKTNKKGVLKNYGEVWFSQEAITNIISLKNIIKKFRVTYDSANGNQFVVHKDNGQHLIFKQSASGLFYHDLDNQEFCMVQTVEENKKHFSERAYKRALEARRLYQIIGTPSLKESSTSWRSKRMAGRRSCRPGSKNLPISGSVRPATATD